jgi:hypothetical protein
VFALHISEQNNTPERARVALARTLRDTAALETIARNEIGGCAL